jgi:hypothetical protein
MTATQRTDDTALGERIGLLASTHGKDRGCSTCLPREVGLFSLGNREESL